MSYDDFIKEVSDDIFDQQVLLVGDLNDFVDWVDNQRSLVGQAPCVLLNDSFTDRWMNT